LIIIHVVQYANYIFKFNAGVVMLDEAVKSKMVSKGELPVKDSGLIVKWEQVVSLSMLILAKGLIVVALGVAGFCPHGEKIGEGLLIGAGVLMGLSLVVMLCSCLICRRESATTT
jgi:hypothetical protein